MKTYMEFANGDNESFRITPEKVTVRQNVKGQGRREFHEVTLTDVSTIKSLGAAIEAFYKDRPYE